MGYKWWKRWREREWDRRGGHGWREVREGKGVVKGITGYMEKE